MTAHIWDGSRWQYVDIAAEDASLVCQLEPAVLIVDRGRVIKATAAGLAAARKLGEVG